MARPRKCWSFTVGERGHRVVAYERAPGGPLWLRWWTPATPTAPGRWRYRALKHSDRPQAEETARRVAGQLLAATLAAESGRTTLAEVFAAYEADVARYAKGDGPAEARRRLAVWTHFLGASRDVATIDGPTLDRYVRERRAGALVVPNPAAEGKPYRLAAQPSNRAIAADLVLLQAALNHATRVVRPNGRPLLAANPVRGYALPRNAQVRRPVATYDRYLALLEHADAADPQRLFGGFLMLLEGLGWRVSAVCGLRACDVDRKAAPLAPHGRIFKRPELDKEGAGGWLPMSASVREGVDRVLAVNPALGEWPLFPAPRARVSGEPAAMPKAWSRHHARQLLERTEAAAKLAPMPGGDFHPYRRKWATERKHLATQDVMLAGGWRDSRSLETAYQHADEATVLAVVTEPRKLREAKADQAHGAQGAG